MVIIGDGTSPKFPTNIPPEILVMLGISGGSYVASKSIQVNKDKTMKDDTQTPTQQTPVSGG